MLELKNLLSADLPDKHFVTSHRISPAAVRAKLKRRAICKMKEKKAEKLIDKIPENGESIHVISAGIFDYWTLIPVLCKLLNEKVLVSRFSTWAMTMPVCTQFIEMMDSGQLGNCGFIADTSLQRLQGAVYAKLATRFNSAKQPLRMTACHAKIALIKTASHNIVMEGSANFTNNPRIEQFCIINDSKIFEFHFQWMQELFKANDEQIN